MAVTYELESPDWAYVEGVLFAFAARRTPDEGTRPSIGCADFRRGPVDARSEPSDSSLG